MTADDSYKQAPPPVRPDFEDLVSRHYEALFRFGMSLTRTEDQACDLVQETFLTWAAKGHQLKDPTRVRSWLFTTLHRKFLETRRRTSRFPWLSMDEAAPELPPVDPTVVDQLDGRRLVELLEQLDPQFRAAVSLFYVEDLSYQEIAEILEAPVGTVKSRISRGIAQLKRLVAPTDRPAAGKEGL